MKKLFLVVAGFLGLLLINNGAFAQEYTEVFSDDFNRAELGNSREIVSSDGDYGSNNITLRPYTINNNALVTTGGGGGFAYPIIYNGQNLRSGKIIFDVFDTSGSNNQLYTAVARLNTNGDYYGAYFSPLTNSIVIKKVIKDGSQTIFVGSTTLCTKFVTIATGNEYRFEFIVNSSSTTVTNLTAKLYQNGNYTTPLGTATCTDTTSDLQIAGKWGVQDYLRRPIDNVIISESNVLLTPNLTTIGINQTIKLQISDTNFDDKTVTLDDNGAGGTFTPATVTLDSANFYTAEIVYTPASIGTVTITADYGSASIDKTIDVYQYNPIIGFIGDSLTVGYGGPSVDVNDKVVPQFITQLGGFPYSALNKGSGGSKASQWAGREMPCDGEQAPDCMANALTTFKNAGTEVVMIMLGVNDSETDLETYKADIQSIINQLKAGGISKIILNQPTYATYKGSVFSQYIDVLKELVDEEYVFLGDNEGYDWVKDNQATVLYDNVHLNANGQIGLATLWVNAYNRVIIEPLTMYHDFINGNNYTLSSSTGLVYQVNKDYSWFTMGDFAGVEVDNVSLTSPNHYLSASGSTTITLLTGYLDTLLTGNHLLTVKFADGVIQTGTFTILPAPVTPPVNPPTVPSSPNVSYGGGGGGGISLVKDSCPNGDLSPSYYDGTCGTTAELSDLVAEKANLLKSLIKLIFIKATEEEKILVHKIITSCSEANKNEIIRLACQELVENWEF